uniref:Uncharacterized protein n=1 Tax=Anguilla anguilla TaxID=7936 RepID=A0A0E9W540_ANGAN
MEDSRQVSRCPDSTAMEDSSSLHSLAVRRQPCLCP